MVNGVQSPAPAPASREAQPECLVLNSAGQMKKTEQANCSPRPKALNLEMRINSDTPARGNIVECWGTACPCQLKHFEGAAAFTFNDTVVSKILRSLIRLRHS